MTKNVCLRLFGKDQNRHFLYMLVNLPRKKEKRTKLNINRVIPPNTTQFLAKKIIVSDFFSVKYTSIGPIRVHTPENLSILLRCNNMRKVC